MYKCVIIDDVKTPVGRSSEKLEEKDLVFFLPVKYLWELDWIEDEERV